MQSTEAEAVSSLICRDLQEINSQDYPAEFIAYLAGCFSPAQLLENARRQHIFVAVEAGQVVGTSGLANFGKPESPSYYAVAVFVQPELQGQGIGKQLMAAVEARALELGAEKITVRAAILNQQSMNHLISIGNRLLYAELTGSGSPTVVIEVGSTQAGTKSRGFWPLRDALAKETGVLLYDRAGMGDSHPVPLPRPISEFTNDLRAVLTSANVPRPYLLVGGSFGGLIVTHYAALYPQDVAGIVLVDSTHPEHNPRTLELLPPETPGEPRALTNFRSLLLQEMSMPPSTFEEEGLDFPTTIRQMRAAWDLGSLPLTVLTAGQDEWEPGFPPDVTARYEQLWLTLQDELAARSTRHKQIVVAESGHCIHDDAPQVLLDAIRALIVNARHPLP